MDDAVRTHPLYDAVSELYAFRNNVQNNLLQMLSTPDTTQTFHRCTLLSLLKNASNVLTNTGTVLCTFRAIHEMQLVSQENVPALDNGMYTTAVMLHDHVVSLMTGIKQLLDRMPPVEQEGLPDLAPVRDEENYMNAPFPLSPLPPILDVIPTGGSNEGGIEPDVVGLLNETANEMKSVAEFSTLDRTTNVRHLTPPPKKRRTSKTSDDGAANKRSGFPARVIEMLRAWLFEHRDNPYPSEDEKRILCHQTGLTMTQLNNWFINARRRVLGPKGREK